MMKLLLRVLLPLAAALAGGQAMACTGALSATGTASDTYDDLSTESIATLQVQVTITDTACNPGIVITGGGTTTQREARAGSDRLRYSITNAAGSTFQNSSASPLAVTVPAINTATAQTLTFRIPAGQVVRAAAYDDTLSLRLVNMSTGNTITAIAGSATTLSLVYRVDVPRVAQINIAGSSGTFGTFAISRLDFGSLATGTARSAFLQIRANAAIAVQVSSANSGVLRRIGTTNLSTVAYQFSLDNRVLALATGPSGFNVQRPSTADGVSLPIQVSVTGSVANLPAGTYQDVLTVDVTPN